MTFPHKLMKAVDIGRSFGLNEKNSQFIELILTIRISSITC